MKLLTRFLKRLGISLEVQQAGICVVCGQGANPVLGVPIATTAGTWKHLVCMLAGQQIADTAEKNAAEANGEPGKPQEAGPVILAIVRPLEPWIWN